MDIRPRDGAGGSEPIKRTVGFSIGGVDEADGGQAGGRRASFDAPPGGGLNGDGSMQGLDGTVGSPSPVLIMPHFDGSASVGSVGENQNRSVRRRGLTPRLTGADVPGRGVLVLFPSPDASSSFTPIVLFTLLCLVGPSPNPFHVPTLSYAFRPRSVVPAPLAADDDAPARSG